MKRKIVALSMACALVASVFVSPSKLLAAQGSESFAGSVAEDDLDDAIAGRIENANGEDTVDIGTTVKLNHYGDAIIYSVAVEWGTMEFTYDYGAVWNPANHKYETNNTTKMVKGGWLTTDYKAPNNGIKITNNSNFPITADLSYQSGFESIGNVTGVFSLANTASDFDTAYGDGTNPANTLSVDLDIYKTNLSGITYWGLKNAGDYSKYVYFAYRGKPDRIEISGETPDSDGTYSKVCTDVGSISVKIAPSDKDKVKSYTP